MLYIDIIQENIDYIEENIKSEIRTEELAELANFSLFHYYRLFQGIVGMPVVMYITKRKLTHAIYEISQGKKVIDVALSYGFFTYAGFYKAFLREFGCSPTEYFKKYKATKPYKINLYKENIMISDKKIIDVLSHWEFKEELEVKNFYYEASGMKAEHIWIVNNQLFLKVTTNKKGLENQIAVSKSLANSGLGVAVIVPTRENTDYYQEGDLYFCITERIEGECIKSSDFYKGDAKPLSRYIGEVIGQLHLILKKHDKEIICNEPNLFETLTNWAIPEVKRQMSLPKEFLDNYIDRFKALYPHLVKQIIHRDPNPSNIMMKDEKIVGLIDFELTERNIRIFDPCYTSTAILSESFVNEENKQLNQWIEIYKNIIRGYDSVCHLSIEEQEAIPYVIYAIQFICVAYFSSNEKYQELAKINKQMLNWLVQNHDLLSII